MFLQDFVMSISPIVIVVLGRLTLHEQTMMSYLSSRYRNKKIVCVHNYMELRSLKEVRAAIEIDMKTCFNSQEYIYKNNVPRFIEYENP